MNQKEDIDEKIIFANLVSETNRELGIRLKNRLPTESPVSTQINPEYQKQ